MNSRAALVALTALQGPASLGLALLLGPLEVSAQTAPAPAYRAHGDVQAEAFVQEEASRVITVLSDRNLGVDAKKQTFRAIVEEVADVPRITGFVLGRYRRVLTADQYARFASAFRAYADNVYESRLGQYHGQTLKVTGSTVRLPGDVVVASLVEGGDGAPTPVNWRVIRGPDGRYRAVDVQVQGVWLAITEQQDFVSTLDNHHGDIDLLISQLKTGPGRG